MRELQLWDAGEAVAGAFADIDELAAGCRFRDCRHADEPGCAVIAAAAAGTLAAARLESFRKLQAEQAFLAAQQDERARIEQKRAGRIGAKALRKRLKDKEYSESWCRVSALRRRLAEVAESWTAGWRRVGRCW